MNKNEVFFFFFIFLFFPEKWKKRLFHLIFWHGNNMVQLWIWSAPFFDFHHVKFSLQASAALPDSSEGVVWEERTHNNRYSWPKIAWEEKTGMETTQTNPINRTNSRSKQQSPHTQLLATINEWFPSVSIYLVFRKIPKIPVKNIFRGQERRGVTSMSIEDFSQGRDVGAKRFCRIRLLKSG